ncbi:hypothetical protein JHY03_30340 [Streptomyces sp. CA-256286]|nr:hypothetical protein JHY03_30340 [Streptomyces sp. CA-256286]
MESIVYEEFGGPDVLHLAEVDAPRPGPGQVRVAVRAAGVNPLDHKIRSGRMEAAFPTHTRRGAGRGGRRGGGGRHRLRPR